MVDKILTVAIGIPAFNEEKNITNLIKSTFAQKEKGFNLDEVIVISDGSTDQTIKKAKELTNKKLKILSYSNRKGKAYRVNSLFRHLKSDILITIDADTVLQDDLVIMRMIQPFRNLSNIGMVAGNPLPLSSQTFIEAAINNYIYGRNKYTNDFPYAKTAYIARGFLAYSRKVAKKLFFPNDTLNEDAYAYFYCITKGYKVYFQKKAVVLYRSPQTIQDYINQATRHYLGGLVLKKYFTPSFINKKFSLPNLINFKIMLYQLKHNPLGYLFLKFLNLYCIHRAKSRIKKVKVKWQSISSTKVLLTR